MTPLASAIRQQVTVAPARYRFGASLAAAYFVVGLLSYAFSSASGALAESVFMHEGFGLAAALIWGTRRVWSGILLGQLALALYQGLPAWNGMLVALANVAVLLVTARLLKGCRFNHGVAAPRDYLLLALACTLVYQPLSRLFGLAVLSMLTGLRVTLAELPDVLSYLWLDQSVFQILVASTVLAAINGYQRRLPGRYWWLLGLSLALLATVLTTMLWCRFTNQLHPLHMLSIVYLLVMVVTAAFELLGAASANLIVLSVMQWASYRERGPLAGLLSEPGQLQNVNTFMAGIILSACLVGTLLRERSEKERALKRLANRDHLTGLYNRRYFFEAAERELSKIKREPAVVTLLWIDIDHFKSINDHHGHAAGDRVLAFFGRLVQSMFRRSDLIARIGGEEFAILTHGDTDTQAIAAKLRAQLQLSLADVNDVVPFTISVGVTALSPGDASIESTLARADAALYEAKANGRDQAVMR
ncbi:diguanylate cyclase [Chitinivorax sp. PXF-14]|uniref:GGDEF domain-containing protein n=1 Tax=Chitinivorax sp. PXF-14 TaxID=3230488 RepID=UPI003466E50D